MLGRIILRGGGVAFAALALLHISGCGTETDGYESTAIYPPRLDPLVMDLSKAQPPVAAPPPGKLDDTIASLPSRGGVIVQPNRLSALQRQSLSNVLTELFGTPAAPKVNVPGADALGFTAEHLAAGSRVYKLQCVQCHGMGGDGRGPTSLWVFPPARDFRQGTFKYVSTPNGQGWPTRGDILRVLRHGIAGNSMPPFALLSAEDLESVTSYTLHLMFRGRVEFETILRAIAPDEESDIAVIARQRLRVNFEDWQRAVKDTVTALPTAIPTDAAAIRRGHATFISEKAACITCHIDYGRRSAWRYDVWGVPVKPANLVEGHHRGGGEALDLFQRLKCGVPGATMPPANQLPEAALCDVVAFLRALPDPASLPDDVRNKVYPNIK